MNGNDGTEDAQQQTCTQPSLYLLYGKEIGARFRPSHDPLWYTALLPSLFARTMLLGTSLGQKE